MTTIEMWLDAQISTLDENVKILRECQDRNSMDRLIIQLWAMKKHVDSTLDFLERKKRFG
ncbi:MAG: hypothetical protein LUQ65_10280 [Candidatus Helarchaeota archaeon]|nr:hypothetical protein [Candidatus Helarchaeota archaeon]